MKVAAYVRVSTDEQAEQGNSLFEQQERMNAYCRAMGWQTATFFIDDGYSAKNLNRPAVSRLLHDVALKKFDVVLNTKLDRLCRNLLDLLQTVNHFQKYNCAYVSVSEGFDTSTAVGRMTMQILGAFAEFERERTRERVKENMISLAKNTNKALASPCYGYNVVDSFYIINDLEAKNVLLMFDLIFEGLGYRNIAKTLNDKGILTRKGKEWDAINVKRLIKNPTLCGTRIFNIRENKDGKIIFRDESEWVISEDNHEAIIDKVVFQAAQTILDSRKPARKHADSDTYLLTSIVRCGHCGGSMGGQTSRVKTKYRNYDYYRYICQSYVKKGGCKYHAIHRDEFESSVLNEIVKFASSSDKDIKVGTNTKTKTEQKNRLITDLAKVDKKMQRQIEAYENELISASDLKTARIRVEAEKALLQKELATIDDHEDDVEQIRVKAKELSLMIDTLDRKTLKFKVRQLIDEIVLTDGNYHVIWRT